MLPHHGGEPQNSTPPYVIALSFDKYDPGNEIEVTLEGTADHGFQGFHLQARELEGDTPVGSFKITDPSTQALACHNVSNSAVSHTNSEVKHKVTTTWIAPLDTKNIQFRATFVQDSKNFWVGVLSKTVTPRHSQSANVTERRNKKKASRIVIEMECTKKGGTYSTSAGCIQGGSSGSSQTSYSSGSSQTSYSIGQGTDGIYNRYGCRDSVSSDSGIQKPVSYPDSKPYPPVRETYPSILVNSGYGSRIIHSQGGQIVNPCDQSSSSYNIIICKLSQSSLSQNSNTKGQTGSSSSQSNGSSQGSQSNSGSSNRNCDQSSSNCAGNKVIVSRDTSRALSRSSYNGQNESSSTNSSSANVQGGAFISFNNTSNGQGLPSGGKQSGGDGSHSSEDGSISSAGKPSSPSLLLLFSVLSAFATSSVVPKWFI
nr:putative ferric-chelate reductase 1 homolog [Chelonoidis abingdonii]